MYWKLWTAVLLLAWFSATGEVQADKRQNIEVLQIWEPQTLQIVNSRSQNDYPSYRKDAVIRGGYNRRRQSLKKSSKASQTTERPIVAIWNNIVDSVRPNFGIRNLTNPWANLFNNANRVQAVPMQSALPSDDKEDEQDQSTGTVTHNSNSNSNPKRKRRRRTQQKRRPSYESQEQDEPQYYYNPPLRTQQQPLYYYGPNVDSYYDLRRLQAFNDYYDQYQYATHSDDEQAEEQQQPHYSFPAQDEVSLGKKYTVLRPLRLAIKLSDSDSTENIAANQDTDSETANENLVAAEVVDENNTMQDDDDDDVADSTSTSASDPLSTSSSSPPEAALSESMRNAIGSYMRDDQHNRQRQRQSERQGSTDSSAKIKPRKQATFVLAARLANALRRK